MISVYHDSTSASCTDALLECIEARSAARGNSALALSARGSVLTFDPDPFDDQFAVHLVFRVQGKVAVYAWLYPQYLSPTGPDEGARADHFELQKLTLAWHAEWGEQEKLAMGRGVRAVLSKALRFAALNAGRDVRISFTGEAQNVAAKLGIPHTAERQPDGTLQVTIRPDAGSIGKLNGLKLASSQKAVLAPANGLVRFTPRALGQRSVN
ncbi:MAG: hypothetical protein AAFY73_03115 [Pseudomonadota bacterium]